MNKLTTRLEKLTEFQKQFESTELRMLALQEEQKKINESFSAWAQEEFGFGDGPQSLPKILKVALETSIEPSRIIV